MATITTQTVTLTIDGREVTVPSGTTIRAAARELGIEIPALCDNERIDPVSVCRMCVVDVGERVLAASCMRECTDGMQIEASSERVEKHRRVLTQLLLDEHPNPCLRERTSGDCELEALGRRYGLLVAESKAGEATDRQCHDDSSPVIDVHHDACILCDRCVRACDELQFQQRHHANRQRPCRPNCV